MKIRSFDELKSEILDIAEGSILDCCRFSTKEINEIDTSNFLYSDFKSFIKGILIGVIEDDLKLLEVLDKFSRETPRLFRHSIRTSTLSIIIGYRLRLSPRDLDYLALGGMLHDIGLLEIVRKYPKLEDIRNSNRISDTELSIWKLHSMVGFNFINEKLPHIKYHVKRIVLLHHVWSRPNLDLRSLSFPKMFEGQILTGVEKDKLVDIVQLSNYIEHEGIGNIGEMLDFINSNIGVIFGSSISKINVFISPFSIGDYILIDTEYSGVIIDHTSNPYKPIVKLDNGEIMDLSKKYEGRGIPNIIVYNRLTTEEFLERRDINGYSCHK